jgi:hypothetical protein
VFWVGAAVVAGGAIERVTSVLVGREGADIVTVPETCAVQ